MKLLTEKELIWSAVVANSAMNRERNASGINSYEQEFGFKPEALLLEYINRQGQAKWLDLCCGQGKALIQVAASFAAAGLQDRVYLRGIDLIDGFLQVPPQLSCLLLEAGSVIDWNDPFKYDFITCVHGIHYIGDKLKLLANMLAVLTPDGLFIGNMDLDNIRINGAFAKDHLQKIFLKHKLEYNVRTRMLKCRGTRNIDFDLEYIGASDQAGPNYTGQAAVNSYYSK